MKMKKWKDRIKGIGGLDYITFLNVPMRESKHGPVIDMDPFELERMAARAIIEGGTPLRGAEVRFLRKVLGLSLEKFAVRLGLVSGSVFKWEKAETTRLHPINEVAVRTFMAEQLKISLPGAFSKLVGQSEEQSPMEIRAS